MVAESGHVVPEPERIMTVKPLDRIAGAVLLVRYHAAHDVFGPFEIAPYETDVNLVWKGRLYRPFEIHVPKPDGTRATAGWCYAPSWDVLKQFAQRKLQIELYGVE